MLTPEWFTAIAAVLTFLAAAGSGYFIAVQVRDMRRNAEATTFMEIAKRFDDPTMISARRWLSDFQDNPRTYQEVRDDPDAWSHLQKIIAFGETIGILVWHKRSSRELVFDKAGPFIFHGYDTLRPICSSLILSGRQLDYIGRVQLEFGENSGTFRLTLSENRLGLHEKNLITSGSAGII